MKKIVAAVVSALALSFLTVNAFADQANSNKVHKMGGMKMDCMKGVKGMDGMEDMKGMDGMKGMKMDCPKKPSGDVVSMAEGEIQELDKVGKNITLKHGPIKSKTVEMGAMTMTFAVKDGAMLRKLKTGEKVKFQVENVKGQPTVVAISPAK